MTGNLVHRQFVRTAEIPLVCVLQALKQDVIRSIIARCELLCEDLLQAEEEQG